LLGVAFAGVLSLTEHSHSSWWHPTGALMALGSRCSTGGARAIAREACALPSRAASKRTAGWRAGRCRASSSSSSSSSSASSSSSGASSSASTSAATRQEARPARVHAPAGAPAAAAGAPLFDVEHNLSPGQLALLPVALARAALWIAGVCVRVLATIACLCAATMPPLCSAASASTLRTPAPPQTHPVPQALPWTRRGSGSGA